MNVHELLCRKDADGHAYPRPMLAREHWVSLNGLWDFAIDAAAEWTSPSAVRWDRQIRVPFSPETEASGIHDTTFYTACWYRRSVSTPPLARNERLVLHFGAVDYRATVWINGQIAAHHEGGYTPFQVDITRFCTSEDPIVIVVRAEDEPDRKGVV
jgi:beta-galactosidase/beta-glucuronidase